MRVHKPTYGLIPMNTASGDRLTQRELEVLNLVASGLSNKAIAEQLVLSPNTVAWYVQQIFSKLHVNRRTEAVAVAREQGLLDTPRQNPSPVNKQQLPRSATALIDRETEIKTITALLKDKDCSLLTLVGPGGIGKTRLALEVATQMAHDFTHGIYFVALQPLTSPENVLPVIASAVGIQLQSDDRSPRDQVLDFCHSKSMLVVIDNFEHLLDGTGIVCDIVSAASDVKILVTSRESLNLQEEHLFPVDGLRFPQSIHDAPQKRFSAIELFEYRARHVYPDFVLAEQWQHVVAICKAVDGIPLALELAASWLKTLSCEEIAKEIQSGLDILVTPLRNVPERHRSMQAVFDFSWQRLSDEERAVFRRLSVFRGGYTREGAVQVAGATIRVLQTLADKSFIRYNADHHRYNIHELMRQYGEQQLSQHPQDYLQTRTLHTNYYAQFLAQSAEDTRSEKQYGLMLILDSEFDNIRVAWNWAIDQSNLEAIQKSAQTLWVHFIFRSRFLEGVEAFERAIDAIKERSPNAAILAELLNLCGWLYIRLSELARAYHMFEHSYTLYQQLQSPLPVGWVTEPLIGLTMTEIIHGNYQKAEDLGKRAVAACTHQTEMNLMLAYYVSAGAAFHQGKYQEAQHYSEQAHSLSEGLGELWVRAEILNDLGRVARELGMYRQAKQHFDASLEIRRRFGDSQGIAAALRHLGQLALLEGEYVEAERVYSESHDLYEKIGDRGGIGYALNGLGTTACKMENYDLAHQHFTHALQIVQELRYAPLTFFVLIGLSQFLLHSEQQERGITLLSLVFHHERSDVVSKNHAKQLLDHVSDDLKQLLSTATFEAAWTQGKTLDLESTVRTFIQQLSGSLTHDDTN